MKLSVRLLLVGLAACLSLSLAPKVADACFCECYLSRDCGTGMKCKWNPVDSNSNRCTNESVCLCREPKPPAVNECSNRDAGGTGNCDGVCVSASRGHACATENVADLALAVQTYGTAFIDAAEAGGGPVDPIPIQAALSLLSDQECIEDLGRNVGSEIEGFAGYSFLTHPGTAHTFDEHEVEDLSSDPCLVSALRLVIDAFEANLLSHGAGDAILSELPALCPQVFDRIIPCPVLGDLACTQQSSRDAAEYLTTPSTPVTASECPPGVPMGPFIGPALVGLTLLGLGWIMRPRRVPQTRLRELLILLAVFALASGGYVWLDSSPRECASSSLSDANPVPATWVDRSVSAGSLPSLRGATARRS